MLNPFLVPQLSCGRQRSTGRRRNGFAKSIATNRRQRPAPPSRTGCLRSRRTNRRRLQSVGKYRRCCERLLFYNRRNAFVFKIHVYFDILKKNKVYQHLSEYLFNLSNLFFSCHVLGLAANKHEFDLVCGVAAPLQGGKHITPKITVNKAVIFKLLKK